MALEPGTRFGPYEISAEIGAGARSHEKLSRGCGSDGLVAILSRPGGRSHIVIPIQKYPAAGSL
jgi:hypothetical protein